MRATSLKDGLYFYVVCDAGNFREFYDDFPMAKVAYDYTLKKQKSAITLSCVQIKNGDVVNDIEIFYERY